jgi:hypothetical protein
MSPAATGGGGDDLRRTGGEVDRAIHLAVADQLLGGGVVDSGDGEPIGDLLVEGSGDLFDRGDGPGDDYRHVVNGGAY